MSLSSHYINHGVIGEADGTKAPHTAELYLIGKTGKILSQRGGTCAAEGEGLFSRYGAGVAEREAMLAALQGFERDNMLFLLHRTPVLLVRSPLPYAGVALAAIPARGVAKTLAYPADFAGVMQHLFLSKTAAARQRTHDSQAFFEACQWYTPFDKAFCSGRGYGEKQAIFNALSIRTTYLALLCGCHVEFDFADLSVLPSPEIELDAYTAALLCVLMAVQRSNAAQKVCVVITHDYLLGPLLQIRFFRADGQESVPELIRLECAAATRGVFYAADVASTGEVRLCLSLTPPELAKQQLKEPLAWRGNGAVAQAPRPRYFTDEQIRAFLNQKENQGGQR